MAKQQQQQKQNARKDSAKKSGSEAMLFWLASRVTKLDREARGVRSVTALLEICSVSKAVQVLRGDRSEMPF